MALHLQKRSALYTGLFSISLPVLPCFPVLEVVPSSILGSNGLFTVKSELNMVVKKEDKDDLFYCEINFFVPAGWGMTETSAINITVYCECHK